MINVVLAIALRHLRSGARQTVLTVGVVAISVTVMVVLGGLIDGVQRRLINSITGAISHVVIQQGPRTPIATPLKSGPLVVERLIPIESTQRKIEDWRQLMDSLPQRSPGIIAISPTADGQGFFSVKSWIRLLQPSGDSETWRVNEKREIQWQVGGIIPYMNFEYSTDAGATWTKEAIVRTTDKKFTWTVPDLKNEKLRIRLSDVKGNATNIHAEAQIRLVGETDFIDTKKDAKSTWWVQSKKR